MDDHAEWFRWTVGGLLGLLVLVVTAIFKHLFAALSGKANRDSTNKRFDHMMNSLADHILEDREVHNQIVQRLDRIGERIGETNVLVARLVGESDARRRPGEK